MSTVLPHLDERQSVIVIAALATTTRSFAEAYKRCLGPDRAREYKAFADQIIRDTRNAVFEGLPMESESAIVEAAEALIADALKLP